MSHFVVVVAVLYRHRKNGKRFNGLLLLLLLYR